MVVLMAFRGILMGDACEWHANVRIACAWSVTGILRGYKIFAWHACYASYYTSNTTPLNLSHYTFL